MNVEVVSIGSELLAGRIADTNAAFISDQVGRIGLEVTRHTVVGDCRKDILTVLAGVSERADAAIVTGGIGPTPDDITRQAMAALCGVPLVVNAEALRHLHAVFARFGRAPSESNAVQASLPRAAELIANPTGTASGFTVRHGKCRFFVLPGVPREMERMFNESVAPRLRTYDTKSVMVRCLQVYGLGESVIGERLRELMGENRNPEVATQAREGIVTVRVTAKGAHPDDAEQRMTPVLTAVRELLGEALFDEEEQTLSQVVAGLLEETGLTLAAAESCTGGELAARLTAVPGISRFFLEAAVTYSDEAKTRRLGVPAGVIERHGAVSAQTAAAMAAGMRESSGADVAIAVTGIAGPAGGSADKPVGLVYIGLADASGATAEEARFAGDRKQVRNRAVHRALNWLRLYLLEQLRNHGE